MQSIPIALGSTGYSGARQAGKRLANALKRLQMPLEQVWRGLTRVGPSLAEGGRCLKRHCIEVARPIKVHQEEHGSWAPRRRRTRRARRRPAPADPDAMDIVSVTDEAAAIDATYATYAANAANAFPTFVIPSSDFHFTAPPQAASVLMTGSQVIESAQSAGSVPSSPAPVTSRAERDDDDDNDDGGDDDNSSSSSDLAMGDIGEIGPHSFGARSVREKASGTVEVVITMGIADVERYQGPDGRFTFVPYTGAATTRAEEEVTPRSDPTNIDVDAGCVTPMDLDPPSGDAPAVAPASAKNRRSVSVASEDSYEPPEPSEPSSRADPALSAATGSGHQLSPVEHGGRPAPASESGEVVGARAPATPQPSPEDPRRVRFDVPRRPSETPSSSDKDTIMSDAPSEDPERSQWNSSSVALDDSRLSCESPSSNKDVDMLDADAEDIFQETFDSAVSAVSAPEVVERSYEAMAKGEMSLHMTEARELVGEKRASSLDTSKMPWIRTDSHGENANPAASTINSLGESTNLAASETDRLRQSIDSSANMGDSLRAEILGERSVRDAPAFESDRILAEMSPGARASEEKYRAEKLVELMAHLGMFGARGDRTAAATAAETTTEAAETTTEAVEPTTEAAETLEPDADWDSGSDSTVVDVNIPRRVPFTHPIEPLDDGWEARVDRFLDVPSDQEIARTSKGQPLFRRDFETLVPRQRPGVQTRSSAAAPWLNDEIVNAYLQLVVDAGEQRAGPRDIPTYHAFNSFFYTKLRQSGPEGVERWLKRANIAGRNLLLVDRLFIPVHQSAHWTLLVVSPVRRYVEYYDSLGGRPDRFLPRIKELLRYTLKKDFVEDHWTFLEFSGPRQENSYDCGVFAVTTAKMLLYNISPLCYSQQDIPAQRRRMAAELINAGFEGDFAPAPRDERDTFQSLGERRPL